MQTLAETLKRFAAFGEETRKAEEPSLESSLESSLDLKSPEPGLHAEHATRTRTRNVARRKAKEMWLRETLAKSLESSLDLKSLESSTNPQSLEPGKLEKFYLFASNELERLQRVLAAWEEAGKPQRATERILEQISKFSDFCRKYEAIRKAPIFEIDGRTENLLPIGYHSHAIKQASKPENLGLIGLNAETAQTIGANLATKRTSSGIFSREKDNERKFERILKDITTNAETATIKPSRKEPREKIFSYTLTAEKCFLAESKPLERIFTGSTPGKPGTVKKQLKLNCCHGLKIQKGGRIGGFVRQLEQSYFSAPKQQLITTWLTIEKPNNPKVKHDRNFQALTDAAKIFAEGYHITFCQISRFGGIQGTYKAVYSKAPTQKRPHPPNYEACEEMLNNGNLRTYTLKQKSEMEETQNVNL